MKGELLNCLITFSIIRPIPRGRLGLKTGPGNFRQPLYRPNLNSNVLAQPWQNPNNHTKITPFITSTLPVSRNRLSPKVAYPRGYSISIHIYPPPRKIPTDG